MRKMIRRAFFMVVASTALLGNTALAQDNAGGGGSCQACQSNPLTGDSWCVAYGEGGTLFGGSGCRTDTTIVFRKVILTCVLTGGACVGGTPLPINRPYL